MEPKKLADLICKRIITNGKMTFSEIEARAIEKGISPDLLDDALELVHKRPKIKVNGETYSEKKVKKVDPFYKPPYPPMIAGVNDCDHPIFHGLDLSFMFLTPEEMKQFKIEQKGGYAGRNARRKK